MKQNKVQMLFDDLVKEYSLRAIEIDGEVWYGINDLPLDRKAINKKIHDMKKINKEFVDDNTQIVRNLTVTLSNLRNFDKVHSTGETFGTFAMVNYIIMSSRLGMEYKIGLIQILDEIRVNDFYIDENILNENYEKLKERYKKLEKEFEVRNGIVKKCYGKKLINIKNISKSTGIDVEFILEHMRKNNWISVKMEVTRKGAYGKVIKKDGVFYLSEEGVKLIQDAYSREINRDIRKKVMKSGENVFDK